MRVLIVVTHSRTNPLTGLPGWIERRLLRKLGHVLRQDFTSCLPTTLESRCGLTLMQLVFRVKGSR